MKRTIVVGAGAIGLACAYSLARRGRQVVIVDKGEPGAACSRGNAGWVVPSLAAPIPAPGLAWTSIKWMLSSASPLYIDPVVAPRLSRWLWRFWRHCNARDHHAGLQGIATLGRGTLAAFDALAKDGVEFELHRDGMLCVYRDARYMESNRQEFQSLKQFGYRVPEPLNRSEVKSLEPGLSDAVTSGFLVPEEYHVRPESFTAGYCSALTRLGVDIRSHVEVRGGNVTAREVVLQTNTGTIQGDELLIAAGAWSGQLSAVLGVRLPIQAGKGYSVTMTGSGLTLQRPTYFGEARIAATPFNGAVRFAGTMELSGINERLDPRRMTGLRRGVARYLTRELPNDGSEWVGMRPLTPDGLPLMGRVPGHGNVWVATGHAMLGITLAPVTGEAMCAMMLGDVAPEAYSEFEPGRFRW